MQSNLLEETTRKIEASGHTPTDVHFIGSKDGKYSMTWEEFTVIANVEYASGYGAVEVAEDLIVQFSDRTYLEREEYDGKEWWKYVSLPPLLSGTEPIHKLIGDFYPTVESLQTGKKADWYGVEVDVD